MIIAMPGVWYPIETVPKGDHGDKWQHPVMFSGYAKAGSFRGRVCVTGWVGSDRRPVHNYRYALTITHWMEQPVDPE